jgi:hypothetical protein
MTLRNTLKDAMRAGNIHILDLLKSVVEEKFETDEEILDDECYRAMIHVGTRINQGLLPKILEFPIPTELIRNSMPLETIVIAGSITLVQELLKFPNSGVSLGRALVNVAGQGRLGMAEVLLEKIVGSDSPVSPHHYMRATQVATLKGFFRILYLCFSSLNISFKDQSDEIVHRVRLTNALQEFFLSSRAFSDEDNIASLKCAAMGKFIRYNPFSNVDFTRLLSDCTLSDEHRKSILYVAVQYNNVRAIYELFANWTISDEERIEIEDEVDRMILDGSIVGEAGNPFEHLDKYLPLTKEAFTCCRMILYKLRAFASEPSA